MAASPGAFLLSTPIPSEFTGRPLTTSLEVPEPEKEKRPPPSLKFSAQKKLKTPVCPPPPTKKARFPTSQAVTSLPSRMFSKVQDRTRYFITPQYFVIHRYFLFNVTQQFPPGTMRRGETKNHRNRGKGKGTHFISLAFYLLA
ncbi:hypothetical protein AVEN_203599-1 [Araneus ventricosus]|uniref:Uncharacterized protein n=1 Tax=Araneus ventricosus TaxID=182803 RepID=A0A4Y2JZD3_ARAVE|nr:hypothetical protein AVEN_203599-1 [Araneus ventricosus]